jgi:cyclohexanone monooxygenase
VHLVDLAEEPIEAITPTGVRTSAGEHALDCLVFATGFDAMTGTLLRMAITGRGGQTIQDAWHAGPRTYLGLGIPGFPNMLTITGPGSPSVLTNMIVSIEHHIGWVADLIAYLRQHDLHTAEATEEATAEWVDHVNAVAGGTLYPTCNSWYLGANVPGKTRVFMPLVGYPQYVARCTEVAEAGYKGFALA